MKTPTTVKNTINTRRRPGKGKSRQARTKGKTINVDILCGQTGNVTETAKFPKRIWDFANFFAEAGGVSLDCLIAALLISEHSAKFKVKPTVSVEINLVKQLPARSRKAIVRGAAAQGVSIADYIKEIALKRAKELVRQGKAVIE